MMRRALAWPMTIVLSNMLGAPSGDELHIVLEPPHDVRARRPELIAAALGWLDKYLGRVQ